jgi:hypothetical protein
VVALIPGCQRHQGVTLIWRAPPVTAAGSGSSGSRGRPGSKQRCLLTNVHCGDKARSAWVVWISGWIRISGRPRSRPSTNTSRFRRGPGRHRHRWVPADAGRRPRVPRPHVGGGAGIGRHIARRLVAPATPSSMFPPAVRAGEGFDTGQGRRTDPVDAHSVAVAGRKAGFPARDASSSSRWWPARVEARPCRVRTGRPW